MTKQMIPQLAQNPKIDSNLMPLSHDVKTSFNMGLMVPMLCAETLPGDRWNINIRQFMRLAPLVSPVMHRIKVTTDTYFVPNRILWDKWEDFITGKVEVEPPKLRFTSPFPEGAPTIGSLGDYLGLPTDINTSGIEVGALQFAAYWKIFQDYYKDQNLSTFPGEFEGCGDGTNNTYLENLSRLPPFRRAWEQDYFRGALPWAQRGNPVQIPLTQNANVTVVDAGINRQGLFRNASGGAAYSGPATDVATSATGRLQTSGGVSELRYDPDGSLVVNVNEDAALIADLKTAFALQAYLERSATGGQRYREWLYANFGVSNDDASLQRPEFLGRYSGVMTISEVLQSVGTEDAALGTMGGHGIGVQEGSVNYYCKEHGFIITLVNVQPDAIYYQGIPRQYSRNTALDYYLEPFARIGEQTIKMKELYVKDMSLTDLQEDFGYQLRYAEYKQLPNRLSGQFRDQLRYWTMARKFDEPPALNQTFIECNPTHQIFAVTDPAVHKIYAQFIFNIGCLRKMPMAGTGMIV